ncbi:unnamed protein product [Cylicocyclus nassatus]|uniref:Uncharacterized protein n=1 Tax=Cylicocyclus nassatus TaxID=53992 RepID=A0AA36DSR8_CYLNA|nr:unnamed protein product [Cylicocyclus nassatus]
MTQLELLDKEEESTMYDSTQRPCLSNEGLKFLETHQIPLSITKQIRESHPQILLGRELSYLKNQFRTFSAIPFLDATDVMSTDAWEGLKQRQMRDLAGGVLMTDFDDVNGSIGTRIGRRKCWRGYNDFVEEDLQLRDDTPNAKEQDENGLPEELHLQEEGAPKHDNAMDQEEGELAEQDPKKTTEEDEEPKVRESRRRDCLEDERRHQQPIKELKQVMETERNFKQLIQDLADKKVCPPR